MPMKKQLEPILISGSRGGLACELSRVLCDHYTLVGMDPREQSPENLFYGETHQTHYKSRKVDDLFRQHKFKAFFHLGRIPATSRISRNDRYSENVMGTQHLLSLCKEHKIPLVVVLSTFHVYGAHSQNPLYLHESDTLRATQTIPQLSDALELDHVASQFALTYNEGNTVILRPSHIVGPKISNALSQIFRMGTVPTPLGFDPLFQLLHQDDLTNILKLILKKPHKGVFNIAGPGVLPLSKLLEIKKIQELPIPDIFLRTMVKVPPFKSANIPNYLIDFFKYSCVIDTSAFDKTYKYKFKHPLTDSILSL